MHVTVRGLRRWILGAAALLMAVVIGFVMYGRYRFRHIEKDLPARLGVNIQQTANGFSYSQSSQGHTLFTLKASKLVQLKAGHALLHDVDITMYGPPGSGRQDRIYGENFDYDQNTGVAVSQGQVNIELQGMGGSAANTTREASQQSTIHVRTSGMTFAQKTGEATTAEPVEFQLPRAAGSSVGADYNSKTGVLVLDSQVKITTSSNGKPAAVQASHATLLRTTMQAFLVNATMQYETESGSSDAATVWFRKDGTTEKIDARGHVVARTDTGATIHAATAQILMDAKSQPVQAVMGGGLTFASVRGSENLHGVAQEGTLQFAAATGGQNAQTELRHAQFRHDVTFTDEVAGLAKDPQGRAEKEIQGQKVDVDFARADDSAQTEARKAWAQGSPVVTLRQMPSRGAQTSTRVSGDRLVAMLAAGNELQSLDGFGNTQVVDESADGARDNSRGDVLHATFAQQGAPVQPRTAGEGRAEGGRTHSGAEKKSGPAPKMETVLETAVQDGHVVLAETPAKKPGATEEPATLRGWAGHAEYHAADQILHLTEKPRVTDGETMQMSAEQIDYHRDTQDAGAGGNVKASYIQGQKAGAAGHPAPSMGGKGPVYVIADRAAMHHASAETFFYGTVQKPARMWQAANSLLAPAIELDQKNNLLKAWGEGTGTEPVVDANLLSAMGAKHAQTVVRVHSQTLIYSDKSRQADFRGSVTAQDADGTIHAEDAVVYSKPAAPAAKAGVRNAAESDAAAQPATGENQNSQIERMIATGHVVFTQPGRRGEGEKLVYTADDGKYVLTGSADAPPKILDRVHGTTTGTALIFNSQNDSVEVSGGKSSAVTDTRAPK